jgi:hypothetical protein
MSKKHETQPQSIARHIAEESAVADAELAARIGLDIKGNPNDPLKGAVEKVIPHRVKIGFDPMTGARLQEIVSNKDREQGKCASQAPDNRLWIWPYSIPGDSRGDAA